MSPEQMLREFHEVSEMRVCRTCGTQLIVGVNCTQAQLGHCDYACRPCIREYQRPVQREWHRARRAAQPRASTRYTPDPLHTVRGWPPGMCTATWYTGKCDRLAFARGMCSGHLTQARRGAEFKPLRPMRPPGLRGQSLAIWCVESGTIKEPIGCHMWRFALRNGYPVVSVDGIQIGVHRLVAQHLIVMRPLAPADVVHHRCATPACIAPADLQVTTAAANTAEMRDRAALLARIADLEAENALLRSNMTKFIGGALVDERGKILKGPAYEPPQIAALLEESGQ